VDIVKELLFDKFYTNGRYCDHFVSFMGRQLGSLGSDLITTEGELHSIRTGQSDKDFQYGRGSEALMNASETASELAIPA
jgi:hypothetical protein